MQDVLLVHLTLFWRVRLAGLVAAFALLGIPGFGDPETAQAQDSANQYNLGTLRFRGVGRDHHTIDAGIFVMRGSVSAARRFSLGTMRFRGTGRDHQTIEAGAFVMRGTVSAARQFSLGTLRFRGVGRNRNITTEPLSMTGYGDAENIFALGTLRFYSVGRDHQTIEAGRFVMHGAVGAAREFELGVLRFKGIGRDRQTIEAGRFVMRGTISAARQFSLGTLRFLGMGRDRSITTDGIVMTGFGEEPPPPITCGLFQVLRDGQCVCETGYIPHGDRCIAPDCPQNTRWDPVLRRCMPR